MLDVLPGILEQDLVVIKEKVDMVAPFVSWVHIDVADKTLVDNETFHDFDLWKGLPETIKYEAHLMVANPEKYIKPLVNAGFSRLIAHVEAQDPRRFLEEVQYEEVEVGLVLDGSSPIEMLEPFFEEVDSVLIMGYEAGFSGQAFQLETIEKIKTIHQSYPEVLLAVDGGINKDTAKLVADAGAVRVVSTSFLFNDPTTIETNIKLLTEQ